MTPKSPGREATLDPQEAREVKRLTDEVTHALERMSRIVLGDLGEARGRSTRFSVVLAADGDPAQIAFGEKVKGPVKAEEEEDWHGYYIDPPGICTSVPYCPA